MDQSDPRTEASEDASAPVCLFCLKTERPFSSSEHILPESMGNREKLLAPGVVCDVCNHGALSDIDNALCNFFPVLLRRTMHGVPTKSGKYLSVPLIGGKLSFLPASAPGGEPTLAITSDNPKRRLVKYTPLGGGRVEVEASIRAAGALTPKHASELSRVLLKIGLELLWLDHRELALSTSLDHVRDAVLGAPRRGFFSVSEGSVDPAASDARVTYQPFMTSPGRCDLIVVLEYKGIAMLTDSRLEAPPPALADVKMVTRSFSTLDRRKS